MAEIGPLIEQFRNIHSGPAWHGAALRPVLTEISAEQAARRPVPGAHSVWELVQHITVWENVFRRRLEGEQVPDPVEDDFPPAPVVSAAAWQQTVADLDREHDELITAISRLKDADLEASFPGKDYSIARLLEVLILHHVYHSGQIALLKKA